MNEFLSKTAAALTTAWKKVFPPEKPGLPYFWLSGLLVAAAVGLGVWTFCFQSVNVTLTASNELLAAVEQYYATSPSDVSFSDVSGADAVSGSDTIVLLPVPVSSTDAFPVSGADVSGADISGSDAAEPDVTVIPLRLRKGSTVADALEAAGIPRSDYVHVSQPLDTILTSGMNIDASLMVKVSISVDGKTIDCITRSMTVRELLSDSDIALDGNERISVDLDEKPSSEMNIVINRVSYVYEKQAEPIPFGVEKRENPDKYAGTEETVVKGEDGEKMVTYCLTYVDEELESKVFVEEEITREPVAQIIEVGTKIKTTTTYRTTKKTTKKTAAKTTRKTSAGRKVVSKEKVYDCDGSGHGYYIITYSDGTVEYKDF